MPADDLADTRALRSRVYEEQCRPAAHLVGEQLGVGRRDTPLDKRFDNVAAIRTGDDGQRVGRHTGGLQLTAQAQRLRVFIEQRNDRLLACHADQRSEPACGWFRRSRGLSGRLSVRLYCGGVELPWRAPSLVAPQPRHARCVPAALGLTPGSCVAGEAGFVRTSPGAVFVWASSCELCPKATPPLPAASTAKTPIVAIRMLSSGEITHASIDPTARPAEELRRAWPPGKRPGAPSSRSRVRR